MKRLLFLVCAALSCRIATASVHSPAAYGAALDGRTNDGAALQRAIDAANAAGGGIVAIPAGRRLLTGSIEMKSHVTLHLEPGSRILASTEPSDYRTPVLIGALGAEEIAFTGSGTIDGRGVEFMAEELPYIFRPKPWRPKLMRLEGCRRVRMSDLTLRDSPSYTVHLVGCDDVAIRGITILNNLKIPNCDGIGPDRSRNVRISDCHIEAGDDGIVIKTTRDNAAYGPSENIVVTNCTIRSSSAALKLGTETTDDIRDVIFSNCVIRGSHRGVAIVLRDAGSIENVLVENLTIETQLLHPAWWGAAEPIYVSAQPRTPGGRIGRVRNLRFSQILARSQGGVFISGSAASKPEDVVLENVTVELSPPADFRRSRIDVRPPEPAEPASSTEPFRAGQVHGVAEAPLAGLRVRDVRDVSLVRCTVRWIGGRPERGRALDAPAGDAVRLEHLREEDSPVKPGAD
jgi:polygalacturonase